MAFEAFRDQAQHRAPSRRRQVTIALSIAVHAAAIAAGVAYSFWHVEELTPPTLRVTFMSAAPPPPPPPPPAGGGGRARPRPQVKPKPVVQPKVAELVEPREIKKEEPREEPKPTKDDKDDGEKAGVKGGVAGGVAGGTLGGTVGGVAGGHPNGVVGGTAPAPPAKFLPPNLGMALKQSGADPPFPATLRRAGAIYRVLAKICVSASGTVDRVTIMKGADPLLDGGVVSAVKGWRFSPNTANGMPIPFCTTNLFEFKSI